MSRNDVTLSFKGMSDMTLIPLIFFSTCHDVFQIVSVYMIWKISNTCSLWFENFHVEKEIKYM